MKLVNAFMIFLGFSLFAACTNDSLPEPDQNPVEETERIIWTGDTITFEKTDGADTDDSANQDRLTENVWLTRRNDGGQIYNAKSENGASKNDSPAGTAWAVGTIDQIDNLDFKPFREAVGQPKRVVGQDLVLHLTAENIYLSVKFTKWSDRKRGGFAYERSSE